MGPSMHFLCDLSHTTVKKVTQLTLEIKQCLPAVSVYCIDVQGGQILRNAISLSCILCQSISVSNIRAKRDNPGLRYAGHSVYCFKL